MGSRAQRLRSLSAIGNAYGITMRAIEAFDGRSLAMHEDAKELPRAPSARPQRYSVNVYDCAGQFSKTECSSFQGAYLAAVAAKALYPGKAVCVFNLDRCDYNTDGLTEDEAEALNDAVSP